MKITRSIPAIALAVAIAGLVSMQAPAAGAANIDFLDVDANKDGKVTPAEVEYIDDLRSSFEALDVNHDQVLNVTEYSHWKRAGKVAPVDPATLPGGSAGAQHMPASH
ncbi:MAG: hypothetical protein ABI616_11115 [Pseudomonadota bacterium]